MVNKDYKKQIFIIGVLFFIFGFVTWLNSTLIPFLKIVCNLQSDLEALLVTFAFYMAYFFLAIPSSAILNITGFKKGMALGLVVMAVGCLIFIPAANSRTFGLFLAGLFVQGAGLSLLQTASNPYASIIGPMESAAQRISILGICNKIAGAISPLIIGAVVLKGTSELGDKIKMAATQAEKDVLLHEISARIIPPYIIMAIVLVVLAFLIYRSSLPEIETEGAADGDTPYKAEEKRSVFAYPHLILGAVCLFLYVGAEVMAGDVIGTYGAGMGMDISVTRFFTTFTLVAMLAGYIISIITIPKYIKQQDSLKYAAILGIIFTIGSYFTTGYTSIICVALLGLANAPMWPAIFPLGINKLGNLVKLGSAIMVMGISGGALMPLLYGYLKDHLHLPNNQAFLVVMLPCYIYILYYAIRGYRVGLKDA